MGMANYVPLRVAKKRLGMTGNTLRKYAEGGKIDYIKNEAGQRLFDVDGYIGKSGAVDEILLLVEKLSDEERKELNKKLCQK